MKILLRERGCELTIRDREETVHSVWSSRRSDTLVQAAAELRHCRLQQTQKTHMTWPCNSLI